MSTYLLTKHFWHTAHKMAVINDWCRYGTTSHHCQCMFYQSTSHAKFENAAYHITDVLRCFLFFARVCLLDIALQKRLN